MPLHLDRKSTPGPQSIDWQRVAFGYEARIEELEICIRAALSFVQGRHTDHNDGHAQMVIAAMRGALAKRERD